MYSDVCVYRYRADFTYAAMKPVVLDYFRATSGSMLSFKRVASA